MSKATVIFAFVLGAAAGSVATWALIKNQQEKKYQEAIESMERVYARRATMDIPEESDETEEEQPEEETPDREMSVRDYAMKLAENGYTDYTDIVKVEPEVESKPEETKPKKIEKKDEVTSVKRPYVISPYDYGELDDYETESLIYYADGVLTSDDDTPIEDVAATVGKDALNHFGEYEDDSVFVRNERLRIDYEILLDSRKYADVKRRNNAE